MKLHPRGSDSPRHPGPTAFVSFDRTIATRVPERGRTRAGRIAMRESEIALQKAPGSPSRPGQDEPVVQDPAELRSRGGGGGFNLLNPPV
jgi:hypothetical protein